MVVVKISASINENPLLFLWVYLQITQTLDKGLKDFEDILYFCHPGWVKLDAWHLTIGTWSTEIVLIWSELDLFLVLL